MADNLDLTTAAGRALAGMLSVFAAFERDLIVERVVSGMMHAKKHGTKSGKPIGAPRTIDKRVTEIRALAQRGTSMAGIARQLGIGYGSVYRVMQEAGKAPAKHKQVGTSCNASSLPKPATHCPQAASRGQTRPLFAFGGDRVP